MAAIEALAALLEYPGPDVGERLAEAERTASELPPRAAEALKEFIDSARRADLLKLQEAYVEAFDFSKDSNLYATYYIYGDSRRRGPALAKLLSIYSSRGFKPPRGELPDHLAVMLRFLARHGPHPAVARLAAKAADKAAAALRRKGSLYAPLLEAVAEALKNPDFSPPRR